jgi:hypothetical protein
MVVRPLGPRSVTPNSTCAIVPFGDLQSQPASDRWLYLQLSDGSTAGCRAPRTCEAVPETKPVGRKSWSAPICSTFGGAQAQWCHRCFTEGQLVTKIDPSNVAPSSNTHHHPAFVAVAEKRAADRQLKIADAVTKFAGSMTFVYVHVVIFAVWMLGFEKSPWPTLTLVVSLEAIFLSTFVMIGQNRQAAFQQAKANHDFLTSEKELHTNTDLTQAIHAMTQQLHGQICLGRPPTAGPT